jgi:isopentenyldiphosphate isomerase
MEERFDLLSDKGEPTGVSCARSEVHACGFFHKAVHIWVLSPSTGEVVLQRRASNKDSWPSFWDVSSAGHVSSGETPLPSALRELEEELGLVVAAPRLEYAFTHLERASSLQNGKQFINNEFQDVFILAVTPQERASLDPSGAVLREGPLPSESIYGEADTLPPLSQFVLQASEVSAVQWVPLERLEAMYRGKDPTIVPWDTEDDLERLLGALKSRCAK